MKRLVFCTPKGGSGKTTLARNIAVASAREPLSVATADLDPQATLTAWSRRRPPELPAIPHYRVSWDDAEALLSDGEVEQVNVLMIDTPPSIEAQPSVFGRLLEAADLIMMPCRPTFDDAESLAPFLRHLRENGQPAVAVLNSVKPRVNINAVKAYLLDAGDLCPVEIADRTDYARAGAKGMGLLDVPGHAGSDEMLAVWRYVRGRIYGQARKRPRAA